MFLLILDRFLTVTSQFADIIIIADQRSTDDSREICRQFAKVIVIDNADSEYNELSRQQQLISAARELVPGPKILMAIDADEILAADSLASPKWADLRRAPPGTALFFEKPDLLSPPNLQRPSTPFPLGYSDDGRSHDGLFIHSTRVPAGGSIPRLDVAGIRFLHLAMTRPHEFYARQRLYSALENVKRTKSVFQRLAYYSPLIIQERLDAVAQPTPPSWWQGWRDQGIDLFDSPTALDNHFNRELLSLFARYGERRFYWDDIWDFDWESLRINILATDPAAKVPQRAIQPPSKFQSGALSLLRWLRLWSMSK
jgi:hypothetical protein